MLKGFIDLTFEYEGRYYVLDYKSNALGDRLTDYSQEALQAAVLEHRYDLQAGLYLLALHRLLRVRLGQDYCPTEHLGGAIYWFMRGLGHPSTGGQLGLQVSEQAIDSLDRLLGQPG